MNVQLFSNLKQKAVGKISPWLKQEGFKRVLNNKILTTVLITIFAISVSLSLTHKTIETIQFQNRFLPPLNIEADFHRFDATEQPKKEVRKKRTDITFGPEIVSRKEKFEIPMGVSVRAELFTGASNGPVKAVLLEPIVVGGENLISEGAILLGQGNSSEDRLYIEFQKIIISHIPVKIKGHAYDIKDQILGLNGNRVSDRALKVIGGLGLGFVGGLSEGLENTQNVNGANIPENSVRNSILNGTAHSTLDESKNLLQSLKEDKPVIEVPAKTSFTILFDEVDPNGTK